MTRKRRIARRVGIISTWFLGVIALFMVTAVVLFYALSDVPRPDTLPLPQVATIEYDPQIGMVDIVEQHGIRHRHNP